MKSIEQATGELTPNQLSILSFVLEFTHTHGHGPTRPQILWHCDHRRRDQWEMVRKQHPRLEPAPWLFPTFDSHP